MFSIDIKHFLIRKFIFQHVIVTPWERLAVCAMEQRDNVLVKTVLLA